jgi:hypothetical protein
MAGDPLRDLDGAARTAAGKLLTLQAFFVK